ncbi:hypothetical protein [Priestia megaterium]|uniref:hypothetical protein n=1 Tax=Priestia megaterium TaxID=1404 RepID=UPI0028775598|nr:hypothetical protein [Priestia megaterium]
MAHYDYLYEDASRKDITERIEMAEKAIVRYDGYKKDLEKDIHNITAEYTKLTLEKEIKEVERWTVKWNKDLINFNNLLKSHDEGQKIMMSALR